MLLYPPDACICLFHCVVTGGAHILCRWNFGKSCLTRTGTCRCLWDVRLGLVRDYLGLNGGAHQSRLAHGLGLPASQQNVTNIDKGQILLPTDKDNGVLGRAYDVKSIC